MVKSLGADQVIDYLTEDFTKTRQKFNCVIDAVGKSSFAKCKPLLEPHGVFTGSEGFENFYLPLFTSIFGNKKVVFRIPTDIKGGLLFIKNLLETKRFRPVIDRRYPLEKIADAFNYVHSGQKTGNVILTLD